LNDDYDGSYPVTVVPNEGSINTDHQKRIQENSRLEPGTIIHIPVNRDGKRRRRFDFNKDLAKTVRA
jgi:hypothetical protein